MAEQGLVVWLVIGLVLGLGAKFLGGGFDMSGCLLTLICGICGAVIGGWTTAHLVGWSDQEHHYSLFAAFVGGLFILWVVDTIAPRRPY